MNAADALRAAVAAAPRIGLAELPDALTLQNRVDHKYLVPADRIEQVVCRLPQFTVLSVAGTTESRYASSYFDDAQLSLFRAHRQRRRRRYKVRTRGYLDSNVCHVEVKLKDRHGDTIKRRLPCDSAELTDLTAQARRFVSEVVREQYRLPVPRLEFAASVGYRRATLACSEQGARITCDTDVSLRYGDRRVDSRRGYVLIETKSDPAGSAGQAIERALRGVGLRPLSLSKYALAIAALRMDGRLAPWAGTARRYLTLGPETSGLPSCSSR